MSEGTLPVVQVPNADLQPCAQYFTVDPQKPLDEQQDPNVLPVQVLPLVPPHIPSMEIPARARRAVGAGVSNVGRPSVRPGHRVRSTEAASNILDWRKRGDILRV